MDQNYLKLETHEHLPLIERVYPLAHAGAFTAVQDAVFCALVNLRLRPRLASLALNGRYVYQCEYRGTLTHVFVLRAAEDVAVVRIYVLGIDSTRGDTMEAALCCPQTLVTLTSMLQAIDVSVIRLLRQGTTPADLLPKIPPKWDMVAVFEWQRIYHPDMTDVELAALCSMEDQSLRNLRSRLNYSKHLYHDAVPEDEFPRRYPLDEILREGGKVRHKKS
jgi:hypothetical protein